MNRIDMSCLARAGAGADPNARNSLGICCTHLAVAAVCYAAKLTGDDAQDRVRSPRISRQLDNPGSVFRIFPAWPAPQAEQALAVVEMLLDAGGDPTIPVRPFGVRVSMPCDILVGGGIEDLLACVRRAQACLLPSTALPASSCDTLAHPAPPQRRGGFPL